MANMGEEAGSWIKILPRLSDSAGAESLFREAIALTPEKRRELIEDFVWALERYDGTFDEAFSRWQVQRGK